MESRPNILFLFTDQQRFDSIAACGYPHMITPHLDRLVRQGVCFTHAFTPSPLCTPARASIMTGLDCRHHGVLRLPEWLDDHSLCWPELLSDAGYDTRAIGKMHFKPWDAAAGFGQRVIAEDKHCVDFADDYAQFMKDAGYERPNPFVYSKSDPEYRQGLGTMTFRYPEAYHIDAFTGAQAVKAIDGAGPSPFCYWVSFNNPHAPIDPPQRYLDLYQDVILPPPIRKPGEAGEKPPNQREMLNWLEQFGNRADIEAMDDDTLMVRRCHYAAAITQVDDWIGQILDALDRKGLTENTVIVFSSDHGEANGDHNMVEKSFFYESMVRIPMIVSWPSRFAPATANAFVSLTDLYPTFLELAGVAMPGEVDGRSLLPFLSDPQRAGRDAIFSELDMWGRSTMIRTREWKYVEVVDRPECCELYDLIADPDELTNLAQESSTRCTVARSALSARIAEWHGA